MLGARGVAEAIKDQLLARMPDETDRIAGDLDVPVPPVVVGSDPHVVELDAQVRLFASTQLLTDDVGIDDWPFLMVVPTRMSGQKRVDVTADGYPVYQRTYRIRVWTFARGDGVHFVAAVRDRVMLVAAETLLRWQTFGSDERSMRVLENDWTEEYSDVGPDPNLGTTVAAGYIDFAVEVTEVLTAVPILPALPLDAPDPDGRPVDLDTRPLPPHPALD